MASSMQFSGGSLGQRLLVWLGLGLAAAAPAHGQTDSLSSIARKLDRYQQAALPEKLFLHLDRPVYTTGETLWFKVYAVDGTYSTPLPLSTVAYVEVMGLDNRPALQAKVALKQATGQGSLQLPANLASGTYTVRAYTNWMKNFGPEYYFQSTVTVLNTSAPSGAVAAKDSATVDVHFFPEGGNLVQGLTSKVAFKLTDKNGHGLAAQGQVVDQQGQVVSTFKTRRLGMGSFLLTPRPGATYMAMVTLPKQPTIRRALPHVYEQGYVLRLENSGPEQLLLTVTASSHQPETLYLLGHSRQKVAVVQQATLVKGHAEFVVRKDQLLEGISHFTLFNARQQPLAERLYCRAPRQPLALTAKADKAQYATRNKVTVQVAAGDNAAPVPASLSMAVYRLDSLNTTPGPAIDHYLGLSADLKGRIENLAYYFTAPAAEAAEAVDLLMLTQGWSRFRWEEVLEPKRKPWEFLPESNGPILQGRLTQAGTNKPRAGVMAYLSSPSRLIRLSNSQSSADGLVQFEMDAFAGVREIVVQTNTEQDSTGQITLLDPFSTQYAATAGRAFSLIERFEHDYARRHLQTQVQNAFSTKLPPHPPVRPVDSLAFYSKADETYFLDKYTRFKVLEEVLREYVPGVEVRIHKDGFHLPVVDKANKQVFDQDPLVLLDGVPIFNMNKVIALNPFKIQKLEVITGRYFQGQTVYHGVVSFTTYKGDLEGYSLDAHALVQRYESVQAQREFYAPRYDTPQAGQSRLPDLRNLLYWNPDIATAAGKASTLDFYTGDQAGRYLVVLQGLAANGQSGSTSFTLDVKPAL